MMQAAIEIPLTPGPSRARRAGRIREQSVVAEQRRERDTAEAAAVLPEELATREGMGCHELATFLMNRMLYHLSRGKSLSIARQQIRGASEDVMISIAASILAA
jgi:hypothetical protein